MPVVIFSIEDSKAVKEEDKEMKAKRLQAQAECKEKLAAAQMLATTKILIPADFAKIEALILARQADQNLNPVRSGSGKRPNPSDAEDRAKGEVSVGSIIGPRKKTKQDYAERIESIKNGREGREKLDRARDRTSMDRPLTTRNPRVQLHVHIKKQKPMKH